MSWKRIAAMATATVLAASACLWAAEANVDQLINQMQGKEQAPQWTARQIEANHVKVLDALLPKMGDEDLGQRQKAQQAYEAICWHAARPGADAEREAACKAMLAKINTDMPQAALIWLLRQLEYIGRDESVKALTKFLDDKDALVRERARRALVSNSSTAASDALLTALGKATAPAWKVALINALGAREYGKSVQTLMSQATSADDSVSAAAIEALARIGDKAAADVIAAAMNRGSDRARNTAAVSYLLLADKLCEKDDRPSALPMYRRMMSSTGHLKCGAIIGLGRAGGVAELPTIFAALADPDAKIRGAGMAALEVMPAEQVAEAINKATRTASIEQKVALLGVLSRRREKTGLPTFITAAADANEDVRVAALEGMGQLGDAGAADALIGVIVGKEGRELTAAREAINRIPGDAATRKLVDALAKAPPKARLELVRCLAMRGAEAVVPALLTVAERDADEAVRAEAVKSLGDLADVRHLPNLVKLMVDAKGASERSNAEKAVLAAGKKIENADDRAKPVLAALPGPNLEARASLLRVLGRIGGTKALAAVRTALNDPNKDVKDAAIRSLADWPDTTAAVDLLAIAGSNAELVHRVLALRGYVRVVCLPSDRSVDATLALLDRAMKVADRTEEKKMVLAGIAEVAHPKALEKVEPYLSDAALRAEAEVATVKIAQAISGTARDEAKAAMQKLMASTRSDGIRKQAQDAINQIEQSEDYITAWEVCGPYTKGIGNKSIFDSAFPPEQPESRGATWKVMPAGTNPASPWLMDLAKAIGGDNRAAYLRTNVYSPQAQTVQLEVGSDDGVKVWLNGKVVHANDASRGVSPGQDKVKVDLKTGWNQLMLKVVNGSGDWGACARVRAATGGKLDGIKTSIEGK